jgi:hypothetical protein
MQFAATSMPIRFLQHYLLSIKMIAIATACSDGRFKMHHAICSSKIIR